MKIRRLKLKIHSLRKVYDNDFEQFKFYSERLGIAGRLGYKNVFTAWKANPNYTINLANNKLTKISKNKKK